MLTSAQTDFFEKQGYLVVEDVLDQKMVLDPVRAEYAELLDELYQGWYDQGRVAEPFGMNFHDKLLAAYTAGCDWFQPMDISLPADEIRPDKPFHFGPAVFDMLRDSKMLDIVESLIGPEITSNPIQHVRIKPPKTHLRSDEARAYITKTDWHQDRGVTHISADDTNMVTVWIAVTNATLKNGCLKVMPGAHKRGLKPHCLKTQVGIPDEFIDEDNAVALPVKSGGIVIFHPLTPHASLVNETRGFRWSFDLRYNVTGQSTGRDHFPSFVARSRTKPEIELNDSVTWKNMWLDARARLSTDSHVPLYRWNDSAPYCA